MTDILKFSRRRQRGEKAIAAARVRKIARRIGQPIDPKDIPGMMFGAVVVLAGWHRPAAHLAAIRRYRVGANMGCQRAP
jgi:hypothetical protein